MKFKVGDRVKLSDIVIKKLFITSDISKNVRYVIKKIDEDFITYKYTLKIIRGNDLVFNRSLETFYASEYEIEIDREWIREQKLNQLGIHEI